MNLASWIILAVVVAVVALAARATFSKGKRGRGCHDAAEVERASRISVPSTSDCALRAESPLRCNAYPGCPFHQLHCMNPCEGCPAVQCKASENARSRT